MDRTQIETLLNGVHEGRIAVSDALDRLRDLAGRGDSGIADLATNPKYLKGFGRWRGLRVEADKQRGQGNWHSARGVR